MPQFYRLVYHVPAKITKIGHQIEIKMYENHFYKNAWEELGKIIEAA